jgi:hypothetical protein
MCTYVTLLHYNDLLICAMYSAVLRALATTKHQYGAMVSLWTLLMLFPCQQFVPKIVASSSGSQKILTRNINVLL